MVSSSPQGRSIVEWLSWAGRCQPGTGASRVLLEKPAGSISGSMPEDMHRFSCIWFPHPRRPCRDEAGPGAAPHDHQVAGRKAKNRHKWLRASPIEIGTTSSSRSWIRAFRYCRAAWAFAIRAGGIPLLAPMPLSRSCVDGSVSLIVFQNRRRPVSYSANKRMM